MEIDSDNDNGSTTDDNSGNENENKNEINDSECDDNNNNDNNNDNTIIGRKRKYGNDSGNENENENENENGPCTKRMKMGGSVTRSTKNEIICQMKRHENDVSGYVYQFDALLERENEFNKYLNVLNEILYENDDLDVTASTLEFILALLYCSKYSSTIWQYFNENGDYVEQYTNQENVRLKERANKIMARMRGTNSNNNNNNNNENSNKMNDSNNDWNWNNFEMIAHNGIMNDSRKAAAMGMKMEPNFNENENGNGVGSSVTRESSLPRDYMDIHSHDTSNKKKENDRRRRIKEEANASLNINRFDENCDNNRNRNGNNHNWRRMARRIAHKKLSNDNNFLMSGNGFNSKNGNNKNNMNDSNKNGFNNEFAFGFGFRSMRNNNSNKENGSHFVARSDNNNNNNNNKNNSNGNHGSNESNNNNNNDEANGIHSNNGSNSSGNNEREMVTRTAKRKRIKKKEKFSNNNDFDMNVNYFGSVENESNLSQTPILNENMMKEELNTSLNDSNDRRSQDSSNGTNENSGIENDAIVKGLSCNFGWDIGSKAGDNNSFNRLDFNDEIGSNTNNNNQENGNMNEESKSGEWTCIFCAGDDKQHCPWCNNHNNSNNNKNSNGNDEREMVTRTVKRKRIKKKEKFSNDNDFDMKVNHFGSVENESNLRQAPIINENTSLNGTHSKNNNNNNNGNDRRSKDSSNDTNEITNEANVKGLASNNNNNKMWEIHRKADNNDVNKHWTRIRLLFNRYDVGDSSDIIKVYECQYNVTPQGKWDALSRFCNPMGDIKNDKVTLFSALDGKACEVEEIVKNKSSILWQKSKWKEYFDGNNPIENWDKCLDKNDENQLFLVEINYEIWLGGNALKNDSLYICNVSCRDENESGIAQALKQQMIVRGPRRRKSGQVLGITRLSEQEYESETIEASINDGTFYDAPTFKFDGLHNNLLKRYYYGNYYFVKNVTIYEIFDDIVFMYEISCYCDKYENMKRIDWYLNKYNICFKNEMDNDDRAWQLSVMKANSIETQLKNGENSKLIDILRDNENVESQMTFGELSNFTFNQDSNDLTLLIDMPTNLKQVSKSLIMKDYPPNKFSGKILIPDKVLVTVIGISLFDVPNLRSLSNEANKDVMSVLNVFSDNTEFNDGIHTYNYTVIYDIARDEETGQIVINRNHVNPRKDRRMSQSEIEQFALLVNEFATAQLYTAHIVFITSHGGIDSANDDFFYSSDGMPISKRKIHNILKFNGCECYVSVSDTCRVKQGTDESEARQNYLYKPHFLPQNKVNLMTNHNNSKSNQVNEENNINEAKVGKELTIKVKTYQGTDLKGIENKKLKDNLVKDPTTNLIKGLNEFIIESNSEYLSSGITSEYGSVSIHCFVNIIRNINDFSRFDVMGIYTLYKPTMEQFLVESGVDIYFPRVSLSNGRKMVFAGRYRVSPPNGINNNNKSKEKEKEEEKEKEKENKDNSDSQGSIDLSQYGECTFDKHPSPMQRNNQITMNDLIINDNNGNNGRQLLNNILLRNELNNETYELIKYLFQDSKKCNYKDLLLLVDGVHTPMMMLMRRLNNDNIDIIFKILDQFFDSFSFTPHVTLTEFRCIGNVVSALLYQFGFEMRQIERNGNNNNNNNNNNNVKKELEKNVIKMLEKIEDSLDIFEDSKEINLRKYLLNAKYYSTLESIAMSCQCVGIAEKLIDLFYFKNSRYIIDANSALNYLAVLDFSKNSVYSIFKIILTKLPTIRYWQFDKNHLCWIDIFLNGNKYLTYSTVAAVSQLFVNQSIKKNIFPSIEPTYFDMDNRIQPLRLWDYYCGKTNKDLLVASKPKKAPKNDASNGNSGNNSNNNNNNDNEPQLWDVEVHNIIDKVRLCLGMN